MSGQAIGDFGLIQGGDRILVALSGGPGSTTLCALLEQHRRRFRQSFQLVPVHLLGKKSRIEPLARLLAGWGLRLECVAWRPAPARKNTRVLTERCRRRNYVLRLEARRLGCNKLADGLLLDHLLEQLLDNLLRQGKISSWPVKKTGADGITVVRPLVYIRRGQAAAYARELGLPQGLDEPRPADAGLDFARRLLQRLEKKNARVWSTMLGALKNVRQSHLLNIKLPGC